MLFFVSWSDAFLWLECGCAFGGNTTEVRASLYRGQWIHVVDVYCSFNLDNLDKVICAEFFHYDEVTFFSLFFVNKYLVGDIL